MSKRILAIEDHEENRRILRLLLQSAGFEMIEALTGEDGVAMAEKERPDLILMDIQLPRMNGIEALHVLRGDDRTRAVPVIAVTASAMSQDRQKIMAAGFDGYQAKPIDVTGFVNAVREMIARGGSAR